VGILRELREGLLTQPSILLERKEMRKIYLLGLTLFAVFAFTALSVSAAFGASEFLLNNLPAANGDAIDAEGELTIGDLGTIIGTVEILCSWILDGHFTSSSTGVVTEVLNLAGEKLTELGAVNELPVECTNIQNCAAPALVWPEKLPWNFELTLVNMGATEYLLDLGTGKEAAFDAECMGGIPLTDLCEGLVTFLLSNGVGDVLAEKNETEDQEELTAKENGNCTAGGVNSADVLTDPGVLILDVPEAGNTLQVSG
jgi:hypothetical protein